MDEKIREEAVDRLEILLKQGVEEEVVWRYTHENKISYSMQTGDGLVVNREFDQDPELKEILRRVEQEYDLHVYYGTFNDMGFTKVLTLLAVSSYTEDWESERADFKHHMAVAYAYDLNARWCEAGTMRYKIKDGGLVRTA